MSDPLLPRVPPANAPGRIGVAVSADDIARCFEVLSQLRPNLEAGNFCRRVQALQASGYVLVYLEADGAVQTVAAYRVLDHLWGGRALYVEDLVTRAGVRSQGYGGRMFEWLVGRARALECAAVHLDSGVERHAAHRFYFAHGMTITDFHFERHGLASDDEPASDVLLAPHAAPDQGPTRHPEGPSHNIASHLRSQFALLDRLLEGRTADDFEHRPHAHAWSAREHLAHIGRYHQIFLERLDVIAGADTPRLERYRAENDPGFAGWLDASYEEVLARLRAVRTQLTERVSRLTDDDLAKSGMHPAFGRMSVALALDFFLAHEGHHLYVLFQRSRERG